MGKPNLKIVESDPLTCEGCYYLYQHDDGMRGCNKDPNSNTKIDEHCHEASVIYVEVPRTVKE